MRSWPLIAALLLLAGCQTLSGVPKSSVRAPTISSDTNVEFTLPADCAGQSIFRVGYTRQERNAWIETTMGCITDNYNTMIADLKRSEVGRGIASGILNLVFGVSSSLTSSAGVKANYAAASLLVTGTNEVIDKEAFGKQTVNALISAMNANRAKAMVPIIHGMSADVDQYPASLAQEHLYTLQRAGSLMEGLQFVAANAQRVVDKSQDDIANIPLNKAISETEAARRGCLTVVLQQLTDNQKGQLERAYEAIVNGGLKAETIDELNSHIAFNHRLNHDAQFDNQLIAELKKQGINIPCGEN